MLMDSLIKPQSWTAQAVGLMHGFKFERFKSSAVLAEVKLKEALIKCCNETSDKQTKPDRIKTALCCQVNTLFGFVFMPNPDVTS